MIRKRGGFVVGFILITVTLFGQQTVNDSLTVTRPDTSLTSPITVEGDTVILSSKNSKPKFMPNPKTALRLSLLTPGLGGGQIYNRDYWKLPFVYAAYGTSIYFVALNIGRYNTMVDHYKEFYFLDDSSAPNYGQRNPDVRTVRVYIKSQNRHVDMTIDQVKRVKDTYRRWRDWSFFALAASYALAAVEANVAAHLKTFDLSDDLTMKIQPSFVQPQLAGVTPGMKLVFTFK